MIKDIIHEYIKLYGGVSEERLDEEFKLPLAETKKYLYELLRERRVKVTGRKLTRRWTAV